MRRIWPAFVEPVHRGGVARPELGVPGCDGLGIRAGEWHTAPSACSASWTVSVQHSSAVYPLWRGGVYAGEHAGVSSREASFGRSPLGRDCYRCGEQCGRRVPCRAVGRRRQPAEDQKDSATYSPGARWWPCPAATGIQSEPERTVQHWPRETTAGESAPSATGRASSRWRRVPIHTLGLRADGTVASAGNNASGQCDADS
jgi:hypothetical protein